MHLRYFLTFLLLLFPLTVNADDGISKQKLTSQGKQRTYYLYAPQTTKSAKSVPVLVLFHPTDRNGSALLVEWRKLADKEGLILVGPDSFAAGWRADEDGPAFIHDLVETLNKKFSIDKSRIYLFGHSAGAVFALDIAMLDSEYFAAVAIHGGAWRTKRESSLATQAKRKIPVKLIIGDRDTSYSLNSVRETEAALRDQLIPVDISILKGHTHWYYDSSPSINQSAWDFLKQHSLSTP